MLQTLTPQAPRHAQLSRTHPEMPQQAIFLHQRWITTLVAVGREPCRGALSTVCGHIMRHAGILKAWREFMSMLCASTTSSVHSHDRIPKLSRDAPQ
eukprot:444380-Amphidinium_carterae.1